MNEIIIITNNDGITEAEAEEYHNKMDTKCKPNRDILKMLLL